MPEHKISEALSSYLQDASTKKSLRDLLSISLLKRGIISESELDEIILLLCSNKMNAIQSANSIRQKYYRTNQAASRYNKIYNSYSKSKRVAMRAEKIAYYLKKDDRLCDIGTGDGLIAHLLSSEYGVNVTATDICDYRDEKSKTNENIHFMQASSISVFNDCDLAYCSYSLHHMQFLKQESIFRQLSKALKPKSRLVILEETPSPEIENEFVTVEKSNNIDEIYSRTTSKEALHLLGVMDYISNWVGNGNYSVPLPLSFRTIEDWIALAERCGFESESITYHGVPNSEDKFTPTPSATLVFSKI